MDGPYTLAHFGTGFYCNYKHNCISIVKNEWSEWRNDFSRVVPVGVGVSDKVNGGIISPLDEIMLV